MSRFPLNLWASEPGGAVDQPFGTFTTVVDVTLSPANMRRAAVQCLPVLRFSVRENYRCHHANIVVNQTAMANKRQELFQPVEYGIEY